MENENKYISDQDRGDTKMTIEKRCPICQALVSREDLYCPDCGGVLKKVCSRCNTKIADGQRFCPECGNDTSIGMNNAIEQYNSQVVKTKSKKSSNMLPLIISVILAVAAIVESGVIVGMSQEINAKNGKISNLNSEISSLNSENSALSSEVNELREMSNFVERHISFIEDDGTYYYHKYSCSRFKGNGFWAYNTEAVPYRYRACPYCH